MFKTAEKMSKVGGATRAAVARAVKALPYHLPLLPLPYHGSGQRVLGASEGSGLI